MAVGFRPQPEDNKLIEAHRRPGESTTDVLRRALRALDREQWDQQAREDMERIAASSEDLSAEPDDWGYDEDGHTVDRRGEAEPQVANASDDDLDTLKIWWVSEDGKATAAPRPEARPTVTGKRITPWPSLLETRATIERARQMHNSWGNFLLLPTTLNYCLSEQGPSEADEDFGAAVAQLNAQLDLTPEHGHAHEGEPKGRTSVPPKLARLHAAAARRAGKR
ncbi:hypothetical protein [Streptomyces sp. NPDC047065]|uniref:hypothetical protein n=1 Tax=Streptomyces sp. NPDC047065 TaxID=3154606 RepID=UPI0033E8C288